MKIFLPLVLLFLVGCSAVAPAMTLPQVSVPQLPAVAVPEVNIPVALPGFPPLAVPLPTSHDEINFRDHAIESHGEMARLARDISKHGKCWHYICATTHSANNALRICIAPSVSEKYGAVMRIFHNGYGWQEGTSFVRESRSIFNIVNSQNCLEVTPYNTYIEPVAPIPQVEGERWWEDE